mgnify:CR=1 FL=1
MVSPSSLDAARATSVYRVRVRFCEADLMGIVHHAAYVPYLEAARVHWMRRRGVTYATWVGRGRHLAVVETGLRYRAPARFDDVLAIHTRLTEVRHASMRFEYEIRRDADLLTTAFTRLACLDDRAGLVRIDDEALAVLTAGELAEAPGELP